MSETLPELWARTASREPQALAVADAASGRTWTRGELAAAAQAWRVEKIGAAAVRGRCVLIAARNSAEWLAAFLALIESGAVPCALDPNEPLAAQLAIAEAIGAAWRWDGGALIEVATARPARRFAKHTCLLKLTSGSTGTPRALRFTHTQIIADGAQVCASMDIRPADVNLAAIPFGHSYGLGNLVVPLLAQGTALVCASATLPHALAADCARWKPAVFPAVPAMLRGLTETTTEPHALASLRTVISAGAPLSRGQAQAFHTQFGIRVHSFYGSSETGGISYDRTGEATLEGRSVGTPLEGVRITFGKAKRFAVTSAAVMGRGVHRPKDRAVLNAAGELVLLGRTGRMVKLAGRRLDPGEVEALLRSVPGVREAFVCLQSGAVETLAALVAGEVEARAIREALAPRTAAWKIPRRIVIVAALPLTARGKLDTRRAREMLG